MILADRLRAAGLDPATIIAHRITLHPRDAVDDIRTTACLAREGHALAYQRMQEGAAFGRQALVAAFIAEPAGRARFLGLRLLSARRRGIAPGDIVYDPDLAHLLHTFISRVRVPTFYDAADDERGSLLSGLAVSWPLPFMISRRRADHPGLAVVSFTH